MDNERTWDESTPESEMTMEQLSEKYPNRSIAVIDGKVYLNIPSGLKAECYGSGYCGYGRMVLPNDGKVKAGYRLERRNK